MPASSPQPHPEYENPLAPDVLIDIPCAPGAEPETELPLFVPPLQNSIRHVRFHVKGRTAWCPNPIVPNKDD